MEMPKDGEVICVFSDGIVQKRVIKWLGLYEVLEQSNAIPVPPHGRLVDSDALMNEFEKAQRTMAQHGQEYSCSFMSSSQEISTEWYCVEDMLENAPTVIQANEVE